MLAGVVLVVVTLMLVVDVLGLVSMVLVLVALVLVVNVFASVMLVLVTFVDFVRVGGHMILLLSIPDLGSHTEHFFGNYS